MSLFSAINFLRFQKKSIVPAQYFIQINGYAGPVTGLGKAKKGKKTGVVVEKKVLPVETDVNKLLKFVCGTNVMKEGKDVEIKPDSEYPDWLWSLRTGPAPKLEELDPNTKEYWKKVRKIGMNRQNKLARLRKF
ncbi:39S ribosomal protein L54, mitochondrial [Cephus cinctus]|uniref:Large ribosomal subunit protein mL54 n=1 Tax=Cephus cinctus TaxID=211228 RepID=A0AAJ7BT86_CEPCN|nr:39S ribosomal protein L54, mitochondrial [Cephus cinctus]